MKKTFFLFFARFAETIGLGLFVNSIFSLQTLSSSTNIIIVMVESVAIIITSTLCYSLANLLAENKKV